jgi:acyl-coenzyme A synthetase/AMP-(fatty) acid ligase
MSNAVVSFADLIFHHALARPEKPAIILADRVATYDMMAQGILRVADRIRALNLEHGTLVCLSIDSPIRHMIVGAALFRLGHPIVSVVKPEDIMPLQLPIGAFLHGPGVPFIAGKRQAVVADDWFEGERRPIAASPPQGFANEQMICCVALSSGTTGRPKAISLTVKAFQQWVMNYYSTLGLGTWERLLLLIGLNSSWGYTIAAHSIFAGRTAMFADTARGSLQMLAVYGADAMAATSNQLRELVREQQKAPVPSNSLRAILTGGGLLSRSLIAEARASLCSSIVNLYGSTEAGGTAFANADQLTAIEGATGFVAPWAEVEIVDEKDKAQPAGSDGILRIRATCQGAPYPPERAALNPSFREGWFYPGDRGQITRDGLMIVNGRTTDVINVGGLKLAPEVIEDILRQHPAVTEVAAFGAMGAGGIEEISIALVTRTPVADKQVIDWSAERGIPVTRVFVVDTLPKSSAGKIHRDQLKRQLLK